MKKRILSVMIITISLCSMANVNAEGTSFFTTFNGVELTEYQYKVLADMFSEERVKTISEDDYKALHVERMIEGSFSYKTEEFEIIDDPTTLLMPYAYHETTAKKITLSRFCDGGICGIAVTNYWKKKPAVTSYDVIGVRFDNSSFYDSSQSFSYVTDSGYSNSYNKKIRSSNGAAFVKKITSDIDYMTIDVNLNYTSNGIVFGSYQHAVKSITLADASNFQFKGTGYGSVFLWPTAIASKYDEMGGVYETLR